MGITKIKLIITTVSICLLMLIGNWGIAQQNPYTDSILFRIRKLTDGGKENDLQFKQIIDLVERNKQEILLDNATLISELNRIRTILSEEQYFNLIEIIYTSHLDHLTIPNESMIRFAKDFIEKNKSSYPPTCKKPMLNILRETRLPFRNLGQLYEGITYFTSLANYFEKKNDVDAASIVFGVLPGFYTRIGLNAKAIYYGEKSLNFLNDNPANDTLYEMLGTSGKVNRYTLLGTVYLDDSLPENAEKNLQLAITHYNLLHKPSLYGDEAFLFLQMARAKVLLNDDSSSYYFNRVFGFVTNNRAPGFEYSTSSYKSGVLAFYYVEKGKYFLSKHQNDSAFNYFNKAIRLKEEEKLNITSAFGLLIPKYYAARLALQLNNPQQAIQLLLPEISELRNISSRASIIDELRLLGEAYAMAGLYKEGYQTQNELMRLLAVVKKESEKARSVSFDIEKKMQEDENNLVLLKAQEESHRKTKYYLFGITALLTLFAVTLGRSIRNKQKSNSILTSKNKDITNALEQLRQTQSQLIQSEKMASLGELTAGIAHEIQNPLNFINNFSEVSNELIDEMKEELETGNLKEATAIADDLKENLTKINHHGKRADAIVKGMLQHSRSSTGQKELTDLNALCDEYLRLAYHGYRSKDNSFNAAFETNLDATLPKIKVISQDIGRVVLNLINNAFYAVNEKVKQIQSANPESYLPKVTVATKHTGDTIEITVADNGNGIPASVVNKIFQPFFTTKPTGQGTGLGLSLSYDIVKAHEGTLKVETKEGEGTGFAISLPVAK